MAGTVVSAPCDVGHGGHGCLKGRMLAEVPVRVKDLSTSLGNREDHCNSQAVGIHLEGQTDQTDVNRKHGSTT